MLPMKRGLLSVVVVALAVSGIARADNIISETLTGTITSLVINNLGGLESAFGNSVADGVSPSVTLSFTYDLTLIDAAIANGLGASTVNASEQSYSDGSGDSAISESLTINSQTFTLGGVSSGGSVTEAAFSFFPSYLDVDVVADGGQIASYLYSGLSFAIGQDTSQAGVDEFVQQLQQAGNVGNGITPNIILDVAGYGYVASIDADFAPSQSTPELPTWLMLIFGLCGLALHWKHWRNTEPVKFGR
jgi:hypothetical protein